MELHVGLWIIPIFVLVVVHGHQLIITDGLWLWWNELCAFAIYVIIAALEGPFGVAGFCLTIVGALLSNTWFIFSRLFFVGDVGSLCLEPDWCSGYVDQYSFTVANYFVL